MQSQLANPLRGVGYRERKRIVRLGRSERIIEDSADASLVHAYLAFFEAYHQRLEKRRFFYGFVKFVYRFVIPWVVIPPLALLVLLAPLVGQWVGASITLGVLVFLVYMRFYGPVIRRRIDHTAELNGWSFPALSRNSNLQSSPFPGANRRAQGRNADSSRPPA